MQWTEKFLSSTAQLLCDMEHVPQFPQWGDGQVETLSQSAVKRIKPDCVNGHSPGGQA